MSEKLKPKPKTIVVTMRAPAALLKHVDRAAAASKRSRSAELLMRLEQSFAEPSSALTATGVR